MSLPVSYLRGGFLPPWFSGAAHPRLIGNARRNQASESLSSVAPGTASFSGGWSHTQMVQENLDAGKTGSYCRDTHRSLALMIVIASVRFRSPDSCRHQAFFEPEDGNASRGKISIRAGVARIRTMARSTRRRAITRANRVVATRIRSSRAARGDATPVQHTPGTSTVVDLCSRRRCVNSNPR
jgi:hypothetical protein